MKAGSGKQSKAVLVIVCIALAVMAVAGWFLPRAFETPVAMSGDQLCNVYTEFGCDKFVIASGGEIEVLSGGTVDFQAGATVGMGATVTFANGALGTPSWAFTNDTNTGFWLVGAENLGVQASGIAVADFDINGLDITGKNSVGSGANILDITSALGAENGDDTINVVNVAPTNADHAGGNNFVNGVMVGNIVGDGQSTETAFNVGTGWDNALDVNGLPIILGADGGVTLDETADDAVSMAFGAAAGTFTINPGNLHIGSGTPSVPLAGGDVYVTDRLETGGNLAVYGSGFVYNDMTISDDSSGGNAGARYQFIGLPAMKMVALGVGTNAAAAGQTLSLMDDSPSGEWAASSANVTVSDDAATWRVGAASLQVDFLVTAVAGDGAHDGVAYDFTDDESIGFWIYADRPVVLGDLTFDITDNGGNHVVDLPALSEDTWQWVELDISALANADKDVISDVSIELTAAGAANVATNALTIYVDGAYKWDFADEGALGVNLVQDGVIDILAIPTAAATDNNLTVLVINTDYFVNYEAGNDAIVWISNQSTNTAVATCAYY